MSTKGYKMFDKIFILDTGGYPIYNGNPVEAVSYFKKLDNQINAEEGECVKCGHVEVELIFNIIESQVIDEYGEYTGERKMTPKRWNRKFLENIKHEKVETQTEKPKGSLDRPNKIKQWIIFTTRDLLSKLSNRQYLAINLLEAPLLAIILAFTIRYVEGAEKTGYAFGKNENAPAYLFICIIVALFMGLTVSAEEIVKDRRIRKREAFLNLSNSSYFISKMGILFFISAVQTLSFVLIGNWILGISGMLWSTWLCLFTVSCFANMLGLNISATFNSAITIYILIPILLIPQMIFSGAMFNFDKLNEWLGSEDKVPIIADIMASRWAFEALAVDEFKSNHFEKQFYNYEKFESVADFKKVYYLPELQQRIEYCIRYVGVSDTNAISRVKNHLKDLEQQYTVLFKVQHEGINELKTRIPPKWFVKGNKDKNYFFCENAVTNISEETASNALHAMKQWNGFENLKNIKNKTLIVWGDKDTAYNLKQVETLNKNIPNSELKIINGCSHNAHLEEPDKINQIIDEFLSN